MVENTVTDRAKLVEAMRKLFLSIDRVAAANGILRAVHAVPEDGTEYPLGMVSNRDSALALAVEVLNEQLGDIYEDFSLVQKAVGINDPLFSESLDAGKVNV